MRKVSDTGSILEFAQTHTAKQGENLETAICGSCLLRISTSAPTVQCLVSPRIRQSCASTGMAVCTQERLRIDLISRASVRDCIHQCITRSIKL